MSNYLLISLCFVGGVLLALQGIANAKLTNYLSNAVLVCVISTSITTAVLLLAYLFTNQKIPESTALANIPAYLWLGGLCPALYLVATIIAIPKIGIGSALIVVICGQILASMVIDHYGILVVAQSLNWKQIAGGALVIAGTVIYRL